MTSVSHADTARSLPTEAAGLMNRMYRRQRHIYDWTRRYYLLGRDQLIDGLQPRAGDTVLEIGCGTGRNLIQAAKQFPHARYRGIDVSTEMLTSAISAIDRNGLSNTIRVAHGDATMFDPKLVFGQADFDHIMISYSLSMIPQWRAVLTHSLSCIKPGGKLHIVDFGGQEQLPGVARAVLRQWLTLFDVTPRDALQPVLAAMASDLGAHLTSARPFRGYAQSFVLTLPSQPKTP